MSMCSNVLCGLIGLRMAREGYSEEFKIEAVF